MIVLVIVVVVGGVCRLTRHPPATSSGLSFCEFFDAVHHADKFVGMKLDFKSPGAVERCLAYVAHSLSPGGGGGGGDDGGGVAAVDEAAQSSVPAAAAQSLHSQRAKGATAPALWLNADIWQGPGGAASPFDPPTFVAQCTTSVLDKQIPATLSLGWTTGSDVAKPYTVAHIENALGSLRDLGVISARTSLSSAAKTDVGNATAIGPQCKVQDYVLCYHRGSWEAGRVVCLNNTRQPPEEWADDDTVNVLLVKGHNDYAIGLHPHQVKDANARTHTHTHAHKLGSAHATINEQRTIREQSCCTTLLVRIRNVPLTTISCSSAIVSSSSSSSFSLSLIHI